MRPDERTRFEAWITQPPYEREVTRFPMDAAVASWPGQYDHYAVQLAWEAWQAASSRTGGDALREAKEEKVT